MCQLYNIEPFANNFNRSLIQVRLEDGSTTKLYVPSREVPGNSDALYCDGDYSCVWNNNTMPIPSSSGTSPNIKTTPTPTTPYWNNLVPISTLSCHDGSKRCKITHEQKMKMIFYFSNDLSSLRSKDVEEWISFYLKRTAHNMCIKTTSVKLTILMDNVNQVNNDVVSLQYQVTIDCFDYFTSRNFILAS